MLCVLYRHHYPIHSNSDWIHYWTKSYMFDGECAFILHVRREISVQNKIPEPQNGIVYNYVTVCLESIIVVSNDSVRVL